MRFRNIALVYECDDATLTCAATLARHHRARLTVVHVMKSVPDDLATFDAGGRAVDVRTLIHRDRELALREAVKSLAGTGVRPRTRLLVGDPFIEIIRDVVAHDRDLVVMTADGSRGLRRRLLGSTASHLVRKCPVPVLVVKPGRRERFQRVAVAVDPGSTEGWERRCCVAAADSRRPRWPPCWRAKPRRGGPHSNPRSSWPSPRGSYPLCSRRVRPGREQELLTRRTS